MLLQTPSNLIMLALVVFAVLVYACMGHMPTLPTIHLRATASRSNK